MGMAFITSMPTFAAQNAADVNSISLATVTTSPVTGAAVAVNFLATTDAITNATTDADFVYRFIGYVSSFPAGGSVSGSWNTSAPTTDTEIFVAGTGTTPSVTEGGGASSTYTVTLDSGTDDEDYTGNASTVATAAVGAAQFSFNPAKVGTYVVTVFNDADNNGAQGVTEVGQTISITVAAAAGLSAGTSTALIIGGNAATAASTTTDATAIAASRTMAAANVANIQVSAKDSDNNAYSSVALSATISGPGYLSWVNADDATPVANSCSATPTYSATVGQSITSQASDATGVLYICANGVAGTATVTVTLTDTVSLVSTQVGSTKTVTFYGSPAKLELAKSVWTNIRSGGVWQDGADADTEAELRALSATVTQSVTIKITDSAGRVANSSAVPTVVPGNTAVIAQGVCGLDDNSSTLYSSGGTGFYNCGFQSASSSKSGDKDTVTIRIVDPADATKFLTVTVNLTIGGAVASEVITTDKATYAPGENMVLTITAKDSAGNPAFDGAATPSAVVASKSAIGLPSAASFYVGGKKSWGSTGGVYAPALGGTFTLTATGTDAAAKTLTATASVTDGNAGLLTQIDALNAKIVALNALIAKIMKKLGVK